MQLMNINENVNINKIVASMGCILWRLTKSVLTTVDVLLFHFLGTWMVENMHSDSSVFNIPLGPPSGKN